MLRALLIDDESAARTDLRSKLAALPDVIVVGEAATLSAARALLAGADYDLVFLEAQPVGRDVIQLVPLVRTGARLIFVTTHERYAARAFEHRAVDTLLKPVDPARLREAIGRATKSTAAAEIPPREITPPAERPVELALTHEERRFLRHMMEAWEDSLPPEKVRLLRSSHARTIHYTPDAEHTRLFLDGEPVSALRRYWSALRARFRA